MNYGKILRLIFDDKVYHVSEKEKTQLRLKNAYGEYTYPTNVTVGANDHEVYLHFVDINNLVFPAYLDTLPCIEMGSESLSFGSFTQEVFLQNLLPQPRDFEYLELLEIETFGEVELGFDGKIYSENGHLTVGTVAVNGAYCDVNGVPL